MLKAVLLDFNGVVINDEAIHRALIDELLLSENLRPLTPQDYQQFCLGRSDRACLVDLFEHRGRGLAESYLQKLIDRKAHQYHEKLAALETLPIYEGLKAFLEKLQLRRLAIALVTGSVRAEVEYVLERAGLLNYFPVIVAGNDIHASKPQPDGYQTAIAKLNEHRLAHGVEDSLLEDSGPSCRKIAWRSKIPLREFKRPKVPVFPWLVLPIPIPITLCNGRLTGQWITSMNWI